MPVPFQLGLFLTVLVLAAVRFERSLREALRTGRPERAGYDQPGVAHLGDGAPASMRRSARFNWARWYHLVILWGLAFFCTPFLLAVAFPGRVMDVSRSADRALTGGVGGVHFELDAPAGWDVPALTGQERRQLERTLDERTARARTELARASEKRTLALRAGLIVLGIETAFLLALAAALAFARRTHRPWLVTALGGAAAVCSAAAFASAGPVASRLSAVERARRAIEACATAPMVRAEDAGLSAGPVKMVGRPESGSGYFYFRGPGESVGPRARGAGAGRSSPYAGFRLGGAVVPPAGPRDLHVVDPHVRLGRGGREAFIRADEDVLLIGCILSGSVVPWPGYPLIVAPAGAADGALRAAAAGLFGAESRHARFLVLLQLLFGAFAAWFLTVFCSACSEHLVSRIGTRARTGAPAAGRQADA